MATYIDYGDEHPSKGRSLHWLRAGVETRILSVRVPVDIAVSLNDQARLEGITVTWFVNRALRRELERLKLLGPDPSADDLEHGRV
jgi:hypothetical protein